MPIRRPQFKPFPLSLRVKVTLGVALPLIIVLSLFTAIEYARHRESTLANLSFVAAQTSLVIEKSLQHEMLARNLKGIQAILDGVSEDDKIRAIYLLSTTGEVVYAPNGVGVGQQLDNRDPTCQPCHHLLPSSRPASVMVTLPDGQRIFRSMTPILNRRECYKCHDAEDRLNGLLLTDIFVDPLEAPLAADLRENIVWRLTTVLIAVVVVNLVLNRVMVRRLEKVALALTRFGRERLDLRLAVDSPDEIGQLATAFNEMSQRVATEATENQKLSEDLQHESKRRNELLKRLITTQEEERRRVARDLHDDLGQDLAGLATSLEAAERWWEHRPVQARGQLQQARALIAAITERTYALIMALRPSTLDDLGLVAALRAHAKRVLKEVGIELEFESQGLEQRLPPEIETALFRTFQEALNNIVRHSQATRVRIVLAASAYRFDGEISDDGRGFDPRAVPTNGQGPRGLGLLGMQERMAHCGGSLTIHSQSGAGTRLTLTVPSVETHHA